ncbi:hypothetical protein TRSC58_03121 [Trypanosoma rangeli SC58]|uniref:Uncharacterized protein n=1 Tax=Trypanosoma rangeli SC58 TaxID=429131 RepID=A0A061J187_TRYRA|nr:hypothetical protein TRSC58_03121 [Trypanosoma rangeli SC58]
MQWSDTNNPREDSVFARVKAAVRSRGGPKAVVEALRQFRELEDEQKLRGEKGVSRTNSLLTYFGILACGLAAGRRTTCAPPSTTTRTATSPPAGLCVTLRG